MKSNPRIIIRISLLACVLVLVSVPTAGIQVAPWPTLEWTKDTPESQGVDGSTIARLRRDIISGTYGYVDRMVVIRNGFLVVDDRFEQDYVLASRDRDQSNHQYNYYHPSWHPYPNSRNVHTLQSVTKSITATLIGIGLHRGEIVNLDAPLLPFLYDYDLSAVDGRLHNATLNDLLTMRTGIEWHETDRPLNETNSTIQLEASNDWVQFTLNQPMDADPGTKWTYNSGGSHLMSAVVKAATGSYVDEYARQHLFGPLGIDDFFWKKTPKGLPDTEGGLYLEALDLAKIGYLYLRDGVWDEHRVLPVGWVETATDRHVENVNAAGWGYGYQWWRIDRRPIDIWAGLGYGGQYLFVIPAYDIVGVINSWNIFGTEQRSIIGPFVNALLTVARD